MSPPPGTGRASPHTGATARREGHVHEAAARRQERAW